MMTKQKLDYFKNLLDKTMVDLLDEANKTVNDMTTHNGNLPDPTDRATLESDRNFTLRIRDRERKLIGKSKKLWKESIRALTAFVSPVEKKSRKRGSRQDP